MHDVCVDGFWMGKYEVTQAEWQRVMKINPSYFKRDRNPVESVSWNDAQEFIRKLNGKGNGGFRLPTEAQWEYSARSGGRNEVYAGGDEVDRFAWYSGNSGSRTHSVGTKDPNGLGLHDMSGNVREWCEDVYDDRAYDKHSRNNPLIASGKSFRVCRGGSWGNDPGVVRAAFRIGGAPYDRSSLLGFRLVRTDDDKTKKLFEDPIKSGLRDPQLRDTVKKLNTSPAYAKLLSKLIAQDSTGFVELLPDRITPSSEPNSDEASDLLLQAAIARKKYQSGQIPNAIHREIIIALILRGADCNNFDSNNKKTIDYLREQEVSGDEFFTLAIENILQCEQRKCIDNRLEIARQFLDAVIGKRADIAFNLLGEKGKKEFSLEQIAGGMRRMLPENLQGSAQCLSVVKLENNMNCAVCFVKTASFPGVYIAPVQIGEEEGEIKAFTFNP